MGPDNFAHVVINVEGSVGVLIWELAVAIHTGDAGAGGVTCVFKAGNAAELDVEELVSRIGERQRKIQPQARKGRRIRISGVERQIVLAGAENELVGQR